MAEPSLLKCNSLAMADILGQGVFLRTLWRLTKEHDEIDDDDDSLLGAASDAADDMPAYVDAIGRD